MAMEQSLYLEDNKDLQNISNIILFHTMPLSKTGIT
jgi:hypothetical protein